MDISYIIKDKEFLKVCQSFEEELNSDNISRKHTDCEPSALPSFPYAQGPSTLAGTPAPKDPAP